jgi:transcriptional regulator with XRE-family HTH domain
MEHIGKLLKYHRERLGYTQQQIADLTGAKALQNVSYWEKCEDLDKDIVEKYCTVLGLRLEINLIDDNYPEHSKLEKYSSESIDLLNKFAEHLSQSKKEVYNFLGVDASKLKAEEKLLNNV